MKRACSSSRARSPATNGARHARARTETTATPMAIRRGVRSPIRVQPASATGTQSVSSSDGIVR
jgi:hypothetical protein